MDIKETMHCNPTKCISWSAILVGAFVGVGISFLLNLFGVAIGLSAFSMTNEGAMTLAVGGLVGLIASTVIAMFFAGFASGYLGRLSVHKRNLGVIYGFTTWSAVLILTAVLTTHIGGYVNTYSTNITRQTVVVVDAKDTSPKSHRAGPHGEANEAITASKEMSGGMAVGAFVVFALFLFGAIACCFGAHYGMSRRCEE
jgi:hypothetical protein